jgi:hypothetical protein
MLLVMLLFTPHKKLMVNVKLQHGNFRFCLSSEFNVILPLPWQQQYTAIALVAILDNVQ